MNTRKIVFATNNINKLKEIRDILGDKLDVLSLEDIACYEDIPETGNTFRINALQKAQFVKEKYGLDCFADDSGLEVVALNNAPGVYSARYAGEPSNSENNMLKLLADMNGVIDRSACFRTSIALLLNGQITYFEGVIEGEIIEEKRGDSGFGYDPVFIPYGYKKTFAEMSKEEKNKISHRAQAVNKLLAYLSNNLSL